MRKLKSFEAEDIKAKCNVEKVSSKDLDTEIKKYKKVLQYKRRNAMKDCIQHSNEPYDSIRSKCEGLEEYAELLDKDLGKLKMN